MENTYPRLSYFKAIDKRGNKTQQGDGRHLLLIKAAQRLKIVHLFRIGKFVYSYP